MLLRFSIEFYFLVLMADQLPHETVLRYRRRYWKIYPAQTIYF